MDIEDFPSDPFDVRHAERHGLTGAQVRRAAAAGLLCRVGRGIYRRADTPDSVAQRILAVRCTIKAHHVIVDRTAAWIHGVDLLTLGEHDAFPRVETCSLRGRHVTRRPEIAGRARDLRPTDVIEVDGLRVTSPLRTALDLGCHLDRREAFAAMCMLARLHGLTHADLVRELPRFRRRRGVIQCRQLAPLVDPRLESHREAWTLLEIHDAGLPMPEAQWWVVVDSRRTYRLDFAYVSARVCVEYDGFEAHQQTSAQRAHDQERRDWLRSEGWTVIVVRRGDFTGTALQRWLGELGSALEPTYSNRRWQKW